MSRSQKDLGTPVTSPTHVQRAVFIAVLSFLFFMAMMFAYYIRQSVLYFLLATAFLIVYLITMISLIRLRRKSDPPALAGGQNDESKRTN